MKLPKIISDYKPSSFSIMNKEESIFVIGKIIWQGFKEFKKTERNCENLNLN